MSGKNKSGSEVEAPEEENAECMFLKELDHPGYVKVESVSKEVEKYKELDILQKPVDIYLKHCKEHASTYLHEKKLRIPDYLFTRKDMHSRTITNKFHEIFEL